MRRMGTDFDLIRALLLVPLDLLDDALRVANLLHADQQAAGQNEA